MWFGDVSIGCRKGARKCRRDWSVMLKSEEVGKSENETKRKALSGELSKQKSNEEKTKIDDKNEAIGDVRWRSGDVNGRICLVDKKSTTTEIEKEKRGSGLSMPLSLVGGRQNRKEMTMKGKSIKLGKESDGWGILQCQ